MTNMGYCRMQNTAEDLADVFEHWDDAEGDEELRARKRILSLAEQIVECHGSQYEREGD